MTEDKDKLPQRIRLAQALWDATRAEEADEFMPTVMTDLGSCLRVADALIVVGVRIAPTRGDRKREVRSSRLQVWQKEHPRRFRLGNPEWPCNCDCHDEPGTYHIVACCSLPLYSSDV